MALRNCKLARPKSLLAMNCLPLSMSFFWSGFNEQPASPIKAARIAVRTFHLFAMIFTVRDLCAPANTSAGQTTEDLLMVFARHFSFHSPRACPGDKYLGPPDIAVCIVCKKLSRSPQNLRDATSA